MQALHEELADDGLEMVAINLQENGEQVKAFVEELSLTFDVLLDTSGEVGRDYGARGLPTTYIVGKDGLIVARVIGAREWNIPEVREVLGAILQS